MKKGGKKEGGKKEGGREGNTYFFKEGREREEEWWVFVVDP